MKEENKNKKRIKTNITYNNKEDSTKYGEFVSSYFAWIPVKKQKEVAEKLENITKEK